MQPQHLSLHTVRPHRVGGVRASGHTVLGACALTRAAMDQAQHMQASPEWDFPLFFR